MKLYTYFRSSAAYRVRIALNLKKLSAEMIPVNLLKGEQTEATYGAVNPQRLLPALEENGEVLIQSLAIMEYLEETYPEPPILPAAATERARVRALALAVACEIHPLNNLKVLRYLTGVIGASEEQKNAWYKHWVAEGFSGVEAMLAGSRHTGRFCHGDSPSMADCCLVPQVFNARRFNCDLGAYPAIVRVAEECEKHPAFIAAHPDKQKDAA